MSLNSQIETILFVASKPLSVKKIAKVLQIEENAVLDTLKELSTKYNGAQSGIMILQNNDDWQMVSNPDNKSVAENFLKAEVSGELTRPQLETLTVISYCGPITRPELDQIRGVNCSLILRNLMMRGLIKESDDNTSLLPKYEVTMEYLRHLGLNSITELADYEKLHQHEHITVALSASAENPI
ncbi:MAG: SMC-Scp complex subunit ScpB [Candidatus Magasanikbacteria bacterium]|nr:SMC-Scp complex subunit ScpB [Candidatus Magasanikbacteria bacterium]